MLFIDLPFHLGSGVAYKYMCVRCHSTCCGEMNRHLKVRSSEHIGISTLALRKTKPSKESPILNYLLNFNNVPSFEEFTILTNGNNKFVLESLLIKRDRPIFFKKIVLINCIILTIVSFLIVSIIILDFLFAVL